MTTVLVCDDQRALREDLRALLSSSPGIDRVLAIATGEELLACYRDERPDLVLLATRLPRLSGAETARHLVSMDPGARLLMMLRVGERAVPPTTVGNGALGFVVLDGNPATLLAAVASALAAGDLGAPLPRAPLEESFPAPEPPFGAPYGGGGTALLTRPIAPTLAPVSLTQRELQVLHGMAAGRSNAEIGRSLFLSEDTIKTHARRLFRKLGVKDRAQAVALGFRQGLVH